MMPRRTTNVETKFLETSRKNYRTNLASDQIGAEQAFVEIESQVDRKPDPALGRELVGTSNRLKDWLEYEGLFRADQGDSTGFSLVHDALAFRYWSHLVFEEAFARDVRPERFRLGLTEHTFSEGLLALHLGHDATAELVFSRLVRAINEPNKGWRLASSGVTFQLRLYELWTGKATGADLGRLPELGRYESLLDAACTGDRYREDLAWACQEHVAQTRLSRKGYPAFTAGPFFMLPGELVVWLRMRRAQGLETSTEGHPLLETPAATLDPPPAPAASKYRTLLDRMVPHMKAYLEMI